MGFIQYGNKQVSCTDVIPQILDISLNAVILEGTKMQLHKKMDWVACVTQGRM